MKIIATTTVLSLAIAVAAGSAVAAPQDYGNNGRYDNGNNGRYQESSRTDIATVVAVERMGNRGQYERQECWNEQSNRYDGDYYRDGDGRLYRRDSNNKSTGGAIIGALVGGALGNQVGKGDGRKAATVAGAVIGGTIGANRGRDSNDYEYRDHNGDTVRRCRTVYDNNNSSRYGDYDSYKVTYRYAGQTYRTTTTYRPGRTIRVAVNVTPL